MKKLGIVSIVLASLLVGGLSAEEIEAGGKTVYINVDTKAGAELLKSEQEYKSYLDKKAEITEAEKERSSQLKKNCQDINSLKLAVAKLIVEFDKLKSEGKDSREKIAEIDQAFKMFKEAETRETVEIKKEMSNISEKAEGAMKAANNVNVAKEISMAEDVAEVDNTIKESASNKKELAKIEMSKEVKAKTVCTTKVVRTIDPKKIKQSYYDMEDKEFKVIRKFAKIYEYPALGLESIGQLKRGETFIGDMYTAAGWVHIKNGGWVKGYLLNPQVLYNKKAKFDKNNTAFVNKEVKDCK